MKKANGGLPLALWETYSSFANTYGGVIILGLKELDDKRWKTTGLKKTDKEKLLDNFWNLIHNSQKVNINLLSENDMFGGTFRRDHSGDYRCTRLQVKASKESKR